MRTRITVALLLLAAACAGRQETEEEGPTGTVTTKRGTVVTSGRDVGTVDCYVAPEEALRASTCWLKGRDAVVVFDTQLLRDQARWAREAAEKTGDIRYTVVTSSLPTQYFGLPVFGAKNAITSRPVADDIRTRGEDARAFWLPTFAGDLPDEVAVPAQTFDGEKTLELDGTKIELREIASAKGPPSYVIGWLPERRGLVAGGLVTNDVHLWIPEGESAALLQALLQLKELGPRRVFPGWGAPGGPELIDETLDYLRTLRMAVYDLATRPGSPDVPGTSELQAIAGKLERRFPGWTGRQILDLSIGNEWRSQKAGKLPLIEPPAPVGGPRPPPPATTTPPTPPPPATPPPPPPPAGRR